MPMNGTDDTDDIAVLDAQVLDGETHFFSSLLAGDTPRLAQVWPTSSPSLTWQAAG
jgi:hypothetical protein